MLLVGMVMLFWRGCHLVSSSSAPCQGQAMLQGAHHRQQKGSWALPAMPKPTTP